MFGLSRAVNIIRDSHARVRAQELINRLLEILRKAGYSVLDVLNNADAANAYAVTLIDTGLPEEDEKWCYHALAFDPELLYFRHKPAFKVIHYNIMMALFKQGRLEEALK